MEDARWGGQFTVASERVISHAIADALLEPGETEYRDVSDDEAICIGYAVDRPATHDLALEHWLARRCARLLDASLRGSGEGGVGAVTLVPSWNRLDRDDLGFSGSA